MAKTIRLGLALTLGAMPMLAAAATAESFVKRGNALLDPTDLSNLTGAITAFSDALALDPENADAAFGRGYARMLKGDVSGAIADFSHAISLRPNSSEAYSNRGECRLRINDCDGAVADFDHCIKIQPNAYGGYYGRARALRAKGDFGNAVADFSKALDLKPRSTLEYTMIYCERGRTKRAQGDLDGALVDLDLTILMDSECASARLERGQIRLARGELESAAVDFTDAIEAASKLEMVAAYLGRSEARKRLGDLAGSVADLKKVDELKAKPRRQ